jgi:hypothetical protein
LRSTRRGSARRWTNASACSPQAWGSRPARRGSATPRGLAFIDFSSPAPAAVIGPSDHREREPVSPTRPAAPPPAASSRPDADVGGQHDHPALRRA